MDCDLLSVPLWAKAECGGWYPTRSNTSRYWWVLRGVPRGCVCLKQCPPSARLKRSEPWTQGGNACAQEQRRSSRSRSSPTAPPRLTLEPWPSENSTAFTSWSWRTPMTRANCSASITRLGALEDLVHAGARRHSRFVSGSRRSPCSPAPADESGRLFLRGSLSDRRVSGWAGPPRRAELPGRRYDWSSRGGLAGVGLRLPARVGPGSRAGTRRQRGIHHGPASPPAGLDKG